MRYKMMMGVLVVVSALAAGQVRAEPDLRDVTVVNLSAEARRTVAQDRVQGTLNIEATGKTAVAVQESINAKMQAAKAMYGAVRGVKVSTGGYNVYKQTPITHDPKTGQPLTPAEVEAKSYWQGSQQLLLDSGDKEAMLALVGKLQGKGFAVQGLSFYLSREASDALRDDLMDEALGTIKARAERLAKGLGLSKVRYARVDLNGGGYIPPMPMARGAMMMAKAEMASDAMTAPVAQSGESEVVVSVGVEVHLRD